MIYILSVFGLITSGLFFYILLIGLNRKKIHLNNRLSYINQAYESKVELDERRILPFTQRIFYPMKKKFIDIVSKITPQGIHEQTLNQLRSANYPFGLDVAGWLTLRAFISVIIPIMFIIILNLSNMNMISKMLLFIIFLIICILLPNVVLKAKIKSRANKIQKELPDTLDLLTISVEAGLSFEGALERIVDKQRGELAQEFGRVLNEMQLGKTKQEALTNMVNRCNVADLKIFISTILQAEKLGTSIGKVLRTQSDQMRIKRRQRAQEQALKAPVKIVIPLVFFILPSIFIVILGPAVIQIIETFAEY